MLAIHLIRPKSYGGFPGHELPKRNLLRTVGWLLPSVEDRNLQNCHTLPWEHGY